MDGKSCLMPREGWLCHTKIAAGDSMERPDTGKEQRKEDGTNGSQAVWRVVVSLTVKNNQKPVSQ